MDGLFGLWSVDQPLPISGSPMIVPHRGVLSNTPLVSTALFIVSRYSRWRSVVVMTSPPTLTALPLCLLSEVIIIILGLKVPLTCLDHFPDVIADPHR